MYWWYWLWLILTGSRQKALLAEASRLLRKGRFEQAMNYFAAVIRDWPDLPESYAGLAMAYKALKQPKAAQTMEDIAEGKIKLSDNPDDFDTRLNMAKAMLQIKFYGPALVESEAALTINPESVEAMRVASMANRLNRNYKRAHYLIQQALIRDSLNTALYEQMALILKAVKDDSGYQLILTIIQGLRKVEAQPNDADAIESLIILFGQAGYKPLGLEVVDRSLKTYPDDNSLLFIKARMLMDEGDAEEALPVLQKVVQLDPTSHLIHILLARAYYQLNQFAESQKHQELANSLMAIEKIKDPIESQLHMVNFLLHCGHEDRARLVAERMMLHSGNDWQSPYALGLVLLAEKRNKEALDAFMRSTAINSKVPDAYLEVAKLYAKVGNEDKTIAAVRHTAAANPRSPELRRLLARILRQVGKKDLASEEEALADALANQRMNSFDV